MARVWFDEDEVSDMMSAVERAHRLICEGEQQAAADTLRDGFPHLQLGTYSHERKILETARGR